MKSQNAHKSLLSGNNVCRGKVENIIMEGPGFGFVWEERATGGKREGAGN